MPRTAHGTGGATSKGDLILRKEAIEQVKCRNILDVVAPFAVGGVWLWAFSRNLSRHPLLPQHDPALPEVAG